MGLMSILSTAAPRRAAMTTERRNAAIIGTPFETSPIMVSAPITKNSPWAKQIRREVL
jgi:hypothetical protein